VASEAQVPAWAPGLVVDLLLRKDVG